MARAAQNDGTAVMVMTLPDQAPSFPWPDIRFVGSPQRSPQGLADFVERGVRRLLGWPTLGQWTYARAVKRSLRDLPVGSLVICHNDPEMATMLAHSLKALHVVHLFHNPVLPNDRWRRRYRVAPIRSIAVSRAVARSVETTFVLDPLSVEPIFNGVDLDAFSPRPMAPPGPLVISFVGRVGPEKGLDVLLKACLALAGRHRFSVQVVGSSHWGKQIDDDYQLGIASLIEDLNDGGTEVTRLGHLSRAALPEAFRACHIHVVPSRWDEPFGLSLLEGMASGLAVVATASGGMPEVMGGAGTLVARDDPLALAAALDELLNDVDRCRQRGLEARRRAEQFPWSATWRKIAAFMNERP